MIFGNQTSIFLISTFNFNSIMAGAKKILVESDGKYYLEYHATSNSNSNKYDG